MQEYWESYVKTVDGHKALLSFNAGVSDIAPDDSLMYVAFVKVKLNNPQENGLVTQEESHDVNFIEDRLEMESLRWKVGKYIGRIISQGEVNYIYYLKMDFEWSNVVEATMKEFSNYNYEFGSRIDAEWEVYKNLLFPNIKEWQIIVNHHTCDSLKEKGDNLQEARAIEHKAYFKTSKERILFTKELESENFKLIKEYEVPFNNETMYGVVFYRVDRVFYYDIDALSIKIIDLTFKFNGQYDGWECSVIAKEK